MNYGRNPSRPNLLCSSPYSYVAGKKTIPDNLRGVLHMIQSQASYLYTEQDMTRIIVMDACEMA